LRYFSGEDNERGRPNTIRTLMYLIYLRLINDEYLTSPVQELWDVLMIRVGIKVMPVRMMKELLQD